MVAFRKIFPVLAIVALLLGTALTASAQVLVQTPTTAPICRNASSVSPVLRAEGFTELTGDVVLICEGGTPGQTFLVNFQIFLNTQVTSRIIAGTTTNSADLTEAVLIVDEAGGGTRGTPFCLSPGGTTASGGQANSAMGVTCNNTASTGTNPFQTGSYTVFRGSRAPGQGNALLWAGIPVVAPGTAGVQRTFRFTNIRANANGLGVSSTLTPTAVRAFVAVNPPGALAIDVQEQTVGFVQPGLAFDVRACAGGSFTVPNLAQCEARNTNLPTGGSNTSNGVLRFSEQFPSAFKVRIDPTQPAGTTLPAQTAGAQQPGSLYLASESGFVRTELGQSVGVANSGTRLAARFIGIPANSRIFVGTRGIVTGSATGVTGGSAQVVLVSTDPTGSVAFASAGGIGFTAPIGIGGTSTLTCGGDTVPAVELTRDANNNMTAVWEVVTISTADTSTTTIDLPPNGTVLDNVQIPFGVSFTAGQPGFGTGQVRGTFAPFPATAGERTTWQQASATLPIPRFTDLGPEPARLFTIAECVTNLLFPFVTNQAGFETGMAISNTSADIFGTRGQSGACTMNYFGRLASAPGSAATIPAATTTTPLAPGDTLVMTVSSGSVNFQGVPGVAGFQGYVIARCSFQYAHGFAFVSDLGATRLAEGYLAIVLDTPGLNRTGVIGESQAH